MVSRRIVVLNPNTSPVITALLHHAALAYAPPWACIDTRVVATGPEALRTPRDLASATLSVEAAARDIIDCDGLVIAAFGDPGLEAARAAVSCPVVGIGESGLLAAAQAGCFSILTLGREMDSNLRERVCQMGLADRLVDIRYLETTIPDLARAPQSFLSAITREAERSAASGARSMLLGGAPFSGLARQVQSTIPVLDGLGAALARLGAI